MTSRRLAALAAAATLVLTGSAVSAPAIAGGGGNGHANGHTKHPGKKPPKAKKSYVLDVLGDSYGSGAGVPPYSACGRSQSAYGVQIDGRMRLKLDDFVACGGATTTSLIAGGQLEALDADTDVVTLSIGGNDTGWSSVIVSCVALGDAACASAIATAKQTATTVLPERLETVYDGIDSKAPDAKVYVTGYPRLFSPEYGAVFGASPAEQTALNDAADLLNKTMKAQAQSHGYVFVDVTKRFLDHGVNAPEPYLTPLNDPVALHPNVAGYAAYTAAVTAAIKPSALKR
jgi:lysophospholipase L1-like esterase